MLHGKPIICISTNLRRDDTDPRKRIHELQDSYANAILENWYASGLKTVKDVEAQEEQRSKAVPSGSSFSTDSFFEAALKRSYENMPKG